MHLISSALTRGAQTAFGRHLCLHRFKLWWLKPSHGRSGLNVPPETSLLIAERYPPPAAQQQQQQEYVILLPISDTHARASLHRAGGDDGDNNTVVTGGKSSDGGGESSSGIISSATAAAAAADRSSSDPSAALLALSADTGDAATLLPDRLGVLLVATGPDPFRLVRRLVRRATERLRAQLLSLEEKAGPTCQPAAGGAGGGSAGGAVLPAEEGGDGGSAGVRAEGPMATASFVDTFGWCTWDSFYTMVTPEGTRRRARVVVFTSTLYIRVPNVQQYRTRPRFLCNASEATKNRPARYY